MSPSRGARSVAVRCSPRRMTSTPRRTRQRLTPRKTTSEVAIIKVVPVEVEPLQTMLPGDKELALTAQVAFEAEVAEKRALQVANDAAITTLLADEAEDNDEEDDEEE